MPLLMCPNDNSPMQTLERHGVQFDMCPTCRGVWLDRGELEKLMEGAGEDGRASARQTTHQAPPQVRQAPPHDPRYDHRSHDDYRRRDDDDYRYKKKKRFDIFD